jgi:phospholipase C
MSPRTFSVYGPNGFVRYFKGSIGSSSAILDVLSRYHREDCGLLEWKITNLSAARTQVTVLNAYAGNSVTQTLQPNETFEDKLSLQQFFGWYDLIVTAAGDTTFNYRLAGHVETGRDSFSDPALGGLVSLKA